LVASMAWPLLSRRSSSPYQYAIYYSLSSETSGEGFSQKIRRLTSHPTVLISKLVYSKSYSSLMEPISESLTLNATDAIGHLVSQIERVIRGKRTQIEMVVTCLLAGGHILMEDNPGTGKTV